MKVTEKKCQMRIRHFQACLADKKKRLYRFSVGLASSQEFTATTINLQEDTRCLT